MEGKNQEYMKRVHKYVMAMSYYEDKLKKGMITAEDYNKIELKMLATYQLSERSIFRMNVEPSEYDRTIETITIEKEDS